MGMPILAAPSKSARRRPRCGELEMNAWPSAMVAAWIVGIGANAWGAGQGLTVPADQPSWPRWQARVQLNSDAIATTSLTEQIQAFTAPRTRSAALFGDYFLANPWIGETGGLRLTSGLLVGQRGALLGPSGASQLVSNVAASISRMPVDRTGWCRQSRRGQSHLALSWHWLQRQQPARRLGLQRRPGAGGAKPGGVAPGPDDGLGRAGRMGPRHAFDAIAPAGRVVQVLTLSGRPGGNPARPAGARRFAV